jgi:hypothetical protein
MTTALTPALALDFLRQLSADMRGAIVLAAPAAKDAEDAEWTVAAGPQALVAPARALLDHGAVVRARTAQGIAFGVRGRRLAIVVASGPLALPGLALHDLRTALGALGDVAPQDPPTDAPEAAARALLAAL